MKRRLITTSTTFLFAWLLVAAPAQADDTALRKHLLGSWKNPFGTTIVLREDGRIGDSTGDVSGSWYVRAGVLHMKQHREDFFKILSLTETELVIQDMYHGRHTGTWTRAAVSKTSVPSPTATSSADKQAIPNGVEIPQETHSPNGRYGVTVAPFESIKKGEKPQNYLVDLQNKTVLCRLEAELAWEGGQYGTTLVARWSPDSSILVWEVPNKWFPSAVAIVRLRDSRVEWQLDLLRHAQNAILTRTREAAPENYAVIKSKASQFGAAYHDGFSIDVQPLAPPVAFPLKVRVVLTSNPKRIEGEPTLDSHLDGAVNEKGEFSVVAFSLESIASRTWSAASGNESSGNANAAVPSTLTSQERMIRDLYRSLVAGLFLENRPEMSKFLTPELANRITKAVEADLDIPWPFIPGNDFDKKEVLRTLRIEQVTPASDRLFLVTLSNFGNRYSMNYHFQRVNGNWRISDVVMDGRSLLEILPPGSEGASAADRESAMSVTTNSLGTVFENSPYTGYNAYSRRQILRRAQRQLEGADFYHGAIDGAMGPGTQAAIIAWQESENIAVTGLLDHRTLESMSLLGLAEQSVPRRRIYKGEQVREYDPGPDAAEVLRRVLPWTP